MSLEQLAPDLDMPLDPGIRDAVLILRSAGVETFESCEASPGHSFAEPTIRFHGDTWAGFRAFAVAMENGLAVASLRRAYDVINSQLHGPWWEMTFHTTASKIKGHDSFCRADDHPCR